ncbi:hypothetical protein BRD00_11095 [Halobacteriales archaeon QS_8_69_26]|nr:MAG: hypothetical protein BRD00_11095 [Halobacteriales archaeon QS_8_69_26]
MTGLLAAYRPEGSVSRGRVSDLLDAMDYRGHDGRNVAVDGPVGFGCQHFYTTPQAVGQVQPLTVDGVRLLFDGRIDDRDGLIEALPDRRVPDGDPSDAALVAAAYLAWDDSFLDRLVGVFALALRDGPRERLLCARGPAGVRDLYYSTAGEGVVVASDARVVRRWPGVPGGIDERVLGEFLLGDLATPRRTFYEGIRAVEPGTSVVFDGSGADRTRYWDPASFDRVGVRDPEVLADRLAERLRAAVSARLRTRGDPYLLLSGGLDSTLVGATARRVGGGDLRALSMQFADPENADDPERHRAERRRVEVFADEYDVPVEYHPLDGFRTLADPDAHLSPTVEHPSLMPIGALKTDVYPRMSGAGASVFLTGEGGNSFDGTRLEYYDALREGRVHSAVRAMWADPAPLRSILAWNVLAAAAPGLTERAVTALTGDDPTVVPWLDDGFVDRVGLDERTADAALSFDSESARQIFEQRYRSEYLLRVGHDRRKALAAGLQPRHPYLDPRLLEFLFSLPPGACIRDGQDKYFFRRLAEDVLPPAVRDQDPKFWFDSVVRRGLREEALGTVEALLSDSELVRRGIVDEGELRRIAEAYVGGEDSLQDPVWKVVSTELWLDSLAG